MDKQNGEYLYNGILYDHKKKWNTDPCYNMDEPWKYCSKWKKPDTENHILYNFIYVMLRLGKSVETKSRVSGCVGQRGWEDRVVITKGVTYTYP